MKFGDLHATRIKGGWEFRVYVGEKYFLTKLSEEDAYRMSGFIQEVDRYVKGWGGSNEEVLIPKNNE